jgi:lysophospholipase L1-like esterase
MIARPNIDTTLACALAPLLAAQTAWVKLRALALPEPAGDRTGMVGVGPPLRLLVIGDSSAVGVGVDTQDQALTPQLAARLGQYNCVSWRLCGRNGATTAHVPELLAPVAGQTFDLALVIFGVNDAKNLRPELAWRRDLTSLINQLRDGHGTPNIFFSGLPRIGDFPLIPNPLRSILALRTKRFDRALQQVAAAHENCFHLPIDIPLERSGMARDGFHPGAPIYAKWAELAADGISGNIASR